MCDAHYRQLVKKPHPKYHSGSANPSNPAVTVSLCSTIADGYAIATDYPPY